MKLYYIKYKKSTQDLEFTKIISQNNNFESSIVKYIFLKYTIQKIKESFYKCICT